MKNLSLRKISVITAITMMILQAIAFTSCSSKINKKIEDKNILVGNWDSWFYYFKLLDNGKGVNPEYKARTWTLTYEEVDNDWACKRELPGAKKGKPYMANILTFGKPEEVADNLVHIFIVDNTHLSPQLIPYKWVSNKDGETFIDEFALPKEEFSEAFLKKVKD